MKLAPSAVALLALSIVDAHNVRGGDDERENHVRSKVTRAKEYDKSAEARHYEDTAKADGPSLIVGGTTTGQGEYPYYVDLGGCGGSLIAPGVVLSAAHCADGGDTYAGDTVFVGGYFAQQASNGAVAVKVVQQVSHPQYNADTTYMDIMLLKLESPVTAKGNVHLQINRNGGSPSDGQTMTVVGLGATSDGGTSSDQLLQVNLAAFNYEQCNEIYGGDIDRGVMFCAGGVEGKDSCQGDSGGPLVIKSGNTHTQVGVVSFGEGCGKRGTPGVYARVSAAAGWIDSVVCDTFGVSEFCGGGGGSSSSHNSPPATSGGGVSTGSSSSSCPSDRNWKDSDDYGCNWYDEEEKAGQNVCEGYSEEVGTGGKSPADACCSCEYMKK